jgi:hypothetical protein
MGRRENKFTFAELVGHVMGDQACYNSFQKGETAFGGGAINGIVTEMQEFTSLKSQIVISSCGGCRAWTYHEL